MTAAADPGPITSFEQFRAHLEARAASGDAASSTVRLLEGGVHAIGKKLVEEAAETWMAAEHESPERAAEELSQLLYHCQVMALALGLTLPDVYKHL